MYTIAPLNYLRTWFQLQVRVSNPARVAYRVLIDSAWIGLISPTNRTEEVC